jgi:tetratricopeptide (TPR) repeat protein
MMIRIVAAVLAAILLMGQTKPDAHSLYREGYDARVAGDYDAAIRLLTAAIDTGKLNDNDLGTSCNNRGMAFAAKHQFEKALADYNMAIKIAPYYGPAYLNRGNVYSDQGRLDEAIAQFDWLIKMFPDYALPYNSRGAVYFRKHELDNAIADFSAAIRVKPDYAHAYSNRAQAEVGKRNLKQALADFDQAIRINPKDAEVYVNRGETRSELGDESGALADYSAAIALNPKAAQAYNSRGDSYYTAGEIEKALADYATAIRLKPDYSDPFVSRGRITLFHKNRPTVAAADLATSVQLDPKDIYAVIWLHVARSRSGAPDQAELAANAMALGAGDWPWPVVQLFLGATTPDAVRHAAAKAENDSKRREQLCEANFYLGLFNLEHKVADEAKKLIAAAADDCPADMLEKPAAKAELARLAH